MFHLQSCEESKSFVKKKNTADKKNTPSSRKETYQIDGLTFAIIVVFEFPPRESCIVVDNMSF